MSALPPKVDMDQHGGDVCFVPKADIGRCGWVRLVKPTRCRNATCRGAPPTSDDSGEVSVSRVHLAVRLPRSHMMMSGGSDKSVDARGESSNHRRQQRDWP